MLKATRPVRHKIDGLQQRYIVLAKSQHRCQENVNSFTNQAGKTPKNMLQTGGHFVNILWMIKQLVVEESNYKSSFY